MATYSFADVAAAITGPGGTISIGFGAGVAEEGITIEQSEDRTTTSWGADGTPMHSMHAAKGGRATLRLQKTSPTNHLLMTMYNFQFSSAANHGQNTIVVRDPHRGDVITCRECAFARAPSVTYAKDGGMNEWVFTLGYVDHVLGTGQPVAAF
jgi:hypothetical protein